MGDDQTLNRATDLQEQRNTLLRCILAWRELQQVYMPSVASDILPDAHLSAEKPELQPLFLPSQVGLAPQVDYLNIQWHTSSRHLLNCWNLCVSRRHVFVWVKLMMLSLNCDNCSVL